MINFTVPVLALMLTFLAFLASVRYLLARQGFYWMIPIVLSLLLSYENLTTLLEAAQAEGDYPITVATMLPLVIAILWYTMLQSFHYAMKKANSYNRYVEESKATYTEAKFIEKFERRQTIREHKEKSTAYINKPVEPKVPVYNFPSDLDD